MSTDITSQKEEHLPEKHPGVELTEKPFDIDEEDENSPSVWVLGFFFTAIGAVITQYNFFRTTYSSYSIFFVNLATYYLGKAMARILPKFKISLFGQ
ncbi:hypothetical protein MVEG_12195 [Podila verticillata NRRL 6337]|uniref:OPT family small oligopeptide transporter n=1 Tax=Podila verticillata NRRL 6337 TaxID=1069443 RepID=A0A086TJB4_9FUNG|nr:hypothetical protein MVEG_12195 [Podila verticillata NRRL 6337]